MPSLFKMVDGVRVQMSPEEEAQIRADWARVEPPPERILGSVELALVEQIATWRGVPVGQVEAEVKAAADARERPGPPVP